MPTITKKKKEMYAKVQKGKVYSVAEASDLIKKINCTKFDSSVDLHVRLNLDTTKPDQAIRGTVLLPHGTGKVKRVLVLCSPDKESEAKKAGADHVGLDEYIQKIEKEGWLEVDVVIATPNVMAKIGKIGKILGPRNLMPNPKIGTVTNDVSKAIEEIKSGKIAFKADKMGIVHVSIGRISFDTKKIADNALEFLKTINELKPVSVKGLYMRSLYMTSTMSPSILVDTKTV